MPLPTGTRIEFLEYLSRKSSEGMGTLPIYSRPYLGQMHILTAGFFADQAKSAQKSSDRRLRDKVNFLAAAAVNSSVAFLEATINELLVDCHEDIYAKIFRKIPIKSRRPLGTLWKIFDQGRVGVAVLTKYSLALEVLGKKGFDTKTDLWAQAKALIALRNYLTHFVPEDEIVQRFDRSIAAEETRVTKLLKGKFVLHPDYTDRGFAFNKFLSAGCAAWCVRSSVAFADKFFELLKIECPYESVRPALHTLKP